MSWAKVRRWRDLLRERTPPTAGLSEPGARRAWEVALDALDDRSLDAIEAIEGQPFRSAAVVVAGTVLTAPIEWCAVLLGRGTEVILKHPREAAGAAPLLVEAAAEVGLPLAATADRSVVERVDLVVAMGADATIASIRRAIRPQTRLLPHGHRFSAAWVEADWEGVALDAALHDGRGCLSPVLVLTSRPLEEAADALAAALERAEAILPRGAVDPGESAAIRTRRALALATGTLREGGSWSVHGLPPDRLVPTALPRSLALAQVPDAEAAAALLAPWGRALSTVGTDDPAAAPAFVRAGATRICRTGHMQRPPLLRPHDGEDWLRATLRLVDREL